MPLITDPADLDTPSAIIGMLYGQPGSRKTTTALSAPKSVLLDFDRGLHRVNPKYRRPSLQVENYQQVLDLFNGDELAPFDTLVVDTGGKLIDAIIAYVIKKNSKDGNGRGQPSQQGWGSVKAEFTAFVKLCKASGKSVIFTAHESEEKNGEETIKRPDIAGSARKDIVKELDFMGYVELRGDQPVISFDPSDKFYAKNSLGLDRSIIIPDLRDDRPNDFLARYIFKAAEEKLAADSELRRQYENILVDAERAISELADVEQVNAYYTEALPHMPVVWDSVYVAKAALKDKVAELGLEFDREAKLFKAKELPKEEPKEEEKPAKGKKAKGKPDAEAVAAESTPAAEAQPAEAGEAAQEQKEETTGDGFSG